MRGPAGSFRLHGHLSLCLQLFRLRYAGAPEVPVPRPRPPRSRNRPAASPDPDGRSGRAAPVDEAEDEDEDEDERRNQPRGPASNAFVAWLVHELRNFEFGIGGSLDACHACCSGQPGWARYEAVMRGSLDRLGRFLDELRDYGAPPAPVWTERSLDLLLREAVACLDPRPVAGGGGIRLLLREPLPRIRVDERSLVRAFTHLLELALGPSGTRGPVTVHAAGTPEGLGGRVEGARPWPPGLDLARLFEPFYLREAGAGRLALPVARRVFEHHGGGLCAEPGPGGAVRLCFHLPGLSGAG